MHQGTRREQRSAPTAEPPDRRHLAGDPSRADSEAMRPSGTMAAV
ncbi:hypothetical protein [Streptomyces sp. IBSBF 2435]